MTSKMTTNTSREEIHPPMTMRNRPSAIMSAKKGRATILRILSLRHPEETPLENSYCSISNKPVG